MSGSNVTPMAWHVGSAVATANVVSQGRCYLYLARARDDAKATPASVEDDVLVLVTETYETMIVGKAIAAADAALSIANRPWVANTAYARYDDGDPELWTKQFFAVVNAGAFSHVWKVLDNAAGSRSVVAPDVADLSPGDEAYFTSDGYQWQYMATTDAATVLKFGSPEFFPLVANAAVANAAVIGAIDVVQVLDAGRGYGNYVSGAFAAADVRVDGNSALYAITNGAASAANGFYTGCLMYLDSGAGAGQWARVTDYFTTPSGHFARVDPAFPVPPVAGTSYRVSPEVRVFGEGSEASDAVAFAVIDPAVNSVSRVEVLARGSRYRDARANVAANGVVGVTTQARVRPVMGPAGGHGSNACSELGARWLTLAPSVANTESSTIPADNNFGRFGVIRDPAFANVTLAMTGDAGQVTASESVVRVRPILAATGATAQTGNAVILASVVTGRLVANDVAWVVPPTGPSQLASVVSVNSTAVTLNAAATLTASGTANLFLAIVDPTMSAVARQQVSTHTWELGRARGRPVAGDRLVALTSGAYGTVSSVTRAGVAKGYATFTHMWKFQGTMTGTLAQDEAVYEGANLATSTANAFVHSVSTNTGVTTLYVTERFGVFQNTIVGASSNARLVFTQSWGPELEHGSGAVIYAQDVLPINMSANATSRFVLTLEF